MYSKTSDKEGQVYVRYYLLLYNELLRPQQRLKINQQHMTTANVNELLGSSWL